MATIKKTRKPKSDKIKKNDDSVFDFSESTDYKIYAANGAWGGITPRAEYMIEFFLEKQSRPNSVKYSMDSEIKLGNEISRKFSGNKFTREVQCGVVISIAQAETIANWILENIKGFKEKYKEELTK